MKGKIAEIFESIQGEGLYIGERQIFVRFYGCNLSCKFCDTKLDYFAEYEPQPLAEELIYRWDGHHSISFTGGEPLLQKDFLKAVLQLMHKNGFKNYLETNGTLPEALEEVINYVDIVSMDLKLPTSTGLGEFWQEHRRFLKIAIRKTAFLKVVVCRSTKRSDLEEAISLIKEIGSFLNLILQPNSFEYDQQLIEQVSDLRNFCVQQGITPLVVPQIHKIAKIP